MIPSEAVEIVTSDGVRLEALVQRPMDPSGAAVVCHPHPDYGGSMHLPFVELVADQLASAGFTALRFDFRRPGTVRHRRADLAAAVDATGTPSVMLTGWSYGADLALWHAASDERVLGVAAVAPPLQIVPDDVLEQLRLRGIPVVVLSPEHDQYAPPDVARGRATGLIVEVLPDADHFLAGAERAAAGRILELTSRWTSSTLDTERNFS